MAVADKNSWVRIASAIGEIPFSSDGLAQVDVNGKSICLILHKNTISACPATCPHAGGKMADGYIDSLGNIVCPVHKYKFEIHNGRNVTGEGYKLKIYPVEMRENGIFVRIEDMGLF